LRAVDCIGVLNCTWMPELRSLPEPGLQQQNLPPLLKAPPPRALQSLCCILCHLQSPPPCLQIWGVDRFDSFLMVFGVRIGIRFPCQRLMVSFAWWRCYHGLLIPSLCYMIWHPPPLPPSSAISDFQLLESFKRTQLIKCMLRRLATGEKLSES
jgi:hypothetical protein